VCAHIALGYSTLATSLHLSVSTNTVSTLRQRAYRKLGISCMNELFSLCLRSIDTTLGHVDLGREFFEH
jgi:DNA-binding CsgD family transcriptional regulator